MHFVASAIKKARVDKCHAARSGSNTGLQVHAGATLFVHDAELDSAVSQPQYFFHTAKQFGGKCHFSRPVHFGFDDIDRTRARITNTVFAMAFEVVQCDSRGDHGIQNAFWNFVGCAVFVGVQNGGVGHQMADIAQKQQRAAMQSNDLTFFAGVLAIRVEAAGESATTFFDSFGQCAFHNA